MLQQVRHRMILVREHDGEHGLIAAIVGRIQLKIERRENEVKNLRFRFRPVAEREDSRFLARF
jgi:hypothetical protein